MSHHFDALYYGEPIDVHRAAARAAAEKAVEIDPENADAHIVLGYLRAYEGEFEAGVAEFEQGLRLNPITLRGGPTLPISGCSRGVQMRPLNAPRIVFALTDDVGGHNCRELPLHGMYPVHNSVFCNYRIVSVRIPVCDGHAPDFRLRQSGSRNSSIRSS
ncbi:tetratricopeptide (TPR) repeat protein [Sinorhizobium fredii]|nr:Adenylate cyclase [Sinorhizobium fredii CCBAU 25509]